MTAREHTPSSISDSQLETCDCCGDIIGLSKSVFTGCQTLCEKCNRNSDAQFSPPEVEALDTDLALGESTAAMERRLDLRNRIYQLEHTLAALPGAVFGDSDLCPLTHSFANGIYMREIRIPAGTALTGKIHRHSHPNVLLSGEVLVVTEGGGTEHLKAPLAMISAAGTKRAVYAITDCHWITFHNVGDERNLAKIEEIVIVKDYKTFERERLT